MLNMPTHAQFQRSKGPALCLGATVVVPALFAVLTHSMAMHVQPGRWRIETWEFCSALMAVAGMMAAARLLRMAPCGWPWKAMALVAVVVHQLFVVMCVLSQYGACPHPPRLIEPDSLRMELECESWPINRGSVWWR